MAPQLGPAEVPEAKAPGLAGFIFGVVAVRGGVHAEVWLVTGFWFSGLVGMGVQGCFWFVFHRWFLWGSWFLL